jgi:poly-gamma-glutamate synthesis protein (capsule biosynthesis protein)
MLATLDSVNKAGFVNAGVGKTLDDAAAPAYLDTPSGRVALISVVSTMMNPAAMAGKQSRRILGRPGVNPLRYDEKIELTPEQFEVIDFIAQHSGVNAKDNISRAEGYQPALPEGVSVLKDLKFFKGNKLCYHTTPNKEDMERVKKAIYEAQMGADYIIVSVHSHEVGGDSKENPAPFLVEFAHQCIDSGAHAVIGHGPHLIRPLEIYKGYPIFYSLGDFMLHNESISKVPEDMYEKYALNSDTTLRELFCKRSANYTRGLMTDHRMFESFIPYFEMEGGKLTHLELLPIELDFEEPRYKNGNPHVSTDHCILERLKEMSAPYGTEIEIDERGIGIVKLT